jgi:lysozyme
MTEQQWRQTAADTARAWLGVREGSAEHAEILEIYNNQSQLPRGTRMRSDWPWCAAFVSAVSIRCGLTDIMPTEMSCPLMIQKYQNLGRWVEDDAYIPAVGDVIFYDWDDTGSGDSAGQSDHVGIVTACDGASMTVVEGNCDNAVKEREIRVNARYIRGFGAPDYAALADEAGESETPAAAPAADENAGMIRIADVAREVIAGKWGNGAARKAALGEYFYGTVQGEVNRLLGG